METGLSERSLRAIANVVYSNERVKDAKIFGSRAIGTFHEGSDIDICLFGEEYIEDFSIQIEPFSLALMR